ncbi:type IX secretion system sortase PorU [candidate division KSB1 bacterium]|nr:type IX secretion system sortase PorU [candidate division KSB1 bacterium]
MGTSKSFYVMVVFVCVILFQVQLRADDRRVKIKIREEGFYRLSGADLETASVDLAGIDPRNICMYNNGGEILPEFVAAERPAELLNVAIEVFDGNDGSFDKQDYILFYGKPAEGLKCNAETGDMEYIRNPYTNHNFYWLYWGGNSGRRIQTIFNPVDVNDPAADVVKELIHIEKDSLNALESGREWCWGILNTVPGRTYPFYFYLPETVLPGNYPVYFCIAGNTNNATLDCRVNGKLNLTRLFHQSEKSVYSTYNFVKNDNNELIIENFHDVQLIYNPVVFDWIEILCRRKLVHKENGLFFSPDTTGDVLFVIKNLRSDSIRVYDVSDYRNVIRLTGKLITKRAFYFKTYVDENLCKRFAVVSDLDFLQPEQIERVVLQDMRNDKSGCDLVILSPEEFFAPAFQIKKLREQHDRISTRIIDIQDVFNEFGRGISDPVAIRDFLKYVYENWQPRPQYVLLFGDGHYDYRNITNPRENNWIPPYETDELDDRNSRATDDFYTFIATMNQGRYINCDFAIGRIPAQNIAEAEAYVNKLVKYETEPYLGDWKSRILFLADDENTAVPANQVEFTEGSEHLAGLDIFNSFRIEKLYEIMFPYEGDPDFHHKRTGSTNVMINAINEGNLFMNYYGHSNMRRIAHESIFYFDRDLYAVNNYDKPFLFTSMGCQFGRYDYPDNRCGSEELLFLENRGAIAVIAASRDVYSYPTDRLIVEFYDELLGKTERPARLGDALRLAKNSDVTHDDVNDQKFHLFGDPCTRLAVPELNSNIVMQSDTLQTGYLSGLSGTVVTRNSDNTSFEGTALINVFDAAKDSVYTTHDGTQVNYVVSGAPVFRGKSKVTDGQFSAQFITPVFLEQGANARAQVYFYNNNTDGWGYKSGLFVRQFNNTITDTIAPEIKLSISDGLMCEDTVGNHFSVKISCFDPGGINITGYEERGIKLHLIESDSRNEYDATKFFWYDPDSYTTGSFEYPFIKRVNDECKLICEVWDNFNNVSRDTLEFNILSVAGEGLAIPDKYVLQQNYPNPFNSSTILEYECPETAEIELVIYNSLGQKVRTLEQGHRDAGTHQARWDGLSDSGQQVASGVYLCTFRVKEKNIVLNRKMMYLR